MNLGLAAVPAEMRNENHLNTNLELYHYTSLLHELVLNVRGGKKLPFKACPFSKSCDAAHSNWCLSNLLQWCTHLLSWKWLSLKPLACECLMKFTPISLSQGWSKEGHINLNVPTETLEFFTAGTIYRLSYPGIRTRAVWCETSRQKTLPLHSFYVYHANNAFVFLLFHGKRFCDTECFQNVSCLNTCG